MVTRKGYRGAAVIYTHMSSRRSGKCLESIIFSRLLGYVEEVGGILERQYDFRKAKSITYDVGFVIESFKRTVNGKGK